MTKGGNSSLYIDNITYEWSKRAVGAALSRYEGAGRTLSLHSGVTIDAKASKTVPTNTTLPIC